MPNTTQRPNRAFRTAYWPDVQRITHTITLTAFVHSWAKMVLKILIPSALTVLQFLAALNRLNRVGYLGCAVAYELLSQQIVIATGRFCSVRTLQRAIPALRVLGLITTRRHTIKDHTGKMSQINLILLTDRALAMWCPSKKSAGSQYLAGILPSPTPAKMAERSNKEQFNKLNMYRQKDVTTRPTTDVERPPSTVEHSASTIPPSDPRASQESIREKSPTSSGPKTEPQGVASDLGQQNTKEKPKGCSAELPPLQPWAPHKRPRTASVSCILHVLHKCLGNHRQNQADAIYYQAKWELDNPVDAPTSLYWQWYLENFPDLPPSDRKKLTYEKIIPTMKNRTPVAAAETLWKYGKSDKKQPAASYFPPRDHIKPSTICKPRPKNEPTHIKNTLNGWLEGFKNRILGE